MIQKLKEKKKVDLKVSIYLIKKKLKKQLNILMMKWMKLQKNFIKQKKEKKRILNYSSLHILIRVALLAFLLIK